MGSGTQQEIRFCRAADGVTLAWARSGRGPPLVKAANWLSHLEYDWQSPVSRPLLERLGRHSTVIRYDERGCGLSDRDVEELGFESWVRDLEAVADAKRRHPQSDRRAATRSASPRAASRGGWTR